MNQIDENQKGTLKTLPKSRSEEAGEGNRHTSPPGPDAGRPVLPWEREFLPRKPPGSDYGYVKEAKLISCTREELIELCKGAGINSTEIHLAWTPETAHAVPVEQIPFLFQSIVDKRRKSARWTLLNSAMFGGLIIGHNYNELNLRHLAVFLMLATILPMICGFRSLRAAKALTPEKLAQEVAETQKPFQLWIGMQKAHFTLGLVLLCSLVTLMQIVSPAFEGAAETAANVKPAVFAGESWRLLTGVFVHAGFMHLMFNAFGLGVFGHWLEVVTGRMSVPIVFLLTAFTGSLFSLYLSADPSVGASGGILGLAGFLFMASRRPGDLPLDDVRMTVATTACFTAVVGMVAYDLFDTAAHLGGLLSGLALGTLIKKPKELAGSRTFQWCGITSCAVLCAGAVLAMYLMTIPVPQSDVGHSGSQGQDSPNEKQRQIPAAAGQTGSQVPPPAPSGPQRPQKTASASQVLRVPQGFPLQGLYPRLSQDTPLYCLDLEQYANGRLDRAWQYPVHTVSLRDLEPGLRVFNGTEFDVRSVIQLRASNALTNYHSEVNGITIDQEAVRVHFLHGTGGVVPDGDPIGSYILRFSDGGETEVPIVYGEHVREWHARSDITSPITAGKLAWSFSSCHQTRLYHQTWTNGTPARRLQSVRFVSGLTACSPFLVAITFDPPDRARSQVEMILRQHEREE